PHAHRRLQGAEGDRHPHRAAPQVGRGQGAQAGAPRQVLGQQRRARRGRVMRTSMVSAPRVALSSAHHASTLDDPAALLARRHCALRTEMVRVSDASFGRDTASLWQTKFTTAFLRSLAAFFLIEDGAGDLVGWSGYRASTIEGERVLYFTSTGLLPRAQGHG